MTSPTWTLALSACQYPGGILDRTPRECQNRREDRFDDRPAGWAATGPAERGLAAAQAWLLERKPDLWVHCGDSVYLDATAGLPSAGTLSQSAEHIYRDARTLSNHYRGGVPAYHLMDDHEIGDNWEPSANRSRQQRLRADLNQARATFDVHSPNARAGEPLWQHLEPACARGNLVFLGDTRSERDTRFVRDPYDARRPRKARLLGMAQMRALKQALLDARRAHSNAFRFVATPSIFLPRHLATIEHRASALRADGWDGYPWSQHELLAAIADHDITNVVFVSGDEHLGCVATAEVQRTDPPSTPVTLWSVHVGAMYAPFPFANAIEAEFADPGDAWTFESGGGTYRCCVRDTWFPHRYRTTAPGEAPGAHDGFAVIEVHEEQPHARADPARDFTVTYHYAWGNGDPVCWRRTAAA